MRRNFIASNWRIEPWVVIALAALVQMVWRHPLAGVAGRAIAVPGALFTAIIGATSTAASGASPLARHLMLQNFSPPRSKAEVTVRGCTCWTRVSRCPGTRHPT